MTSPQFFQRNEAALAEEHRRDQKQRDDDEGGRVPYLFLKPGQTTLRILPPYSPKGVFHHEIFEHAATVDGKYSPIPCGKPYGIECAFCNEGERLYAEGGEAAISAAKELRPRSQFLWNVIAVTTPDGKSSPKQGTKVLKTGVGLKRDILDLDQNSASGWADVTNLEQGVSIIISRTGSGKMGTKYNITPHAQRSGINEVLSQGGLSVQDITMFNLEELVDAPTEEGLTHALAETLSAPGFSVPAPAATLTPNPVTPTVVQVSTPAPTVATPTTVSPPTAPPMITTSALPLPPPPAPVISKEGE